MKKKFFCGFTTAIAAIMLLSGCGAGKISDVKPAERFSDCFAGNSVISVTSLDLTGYTVKDYKNGAVLFEKINGQETDYAVYFAPSGKTVKFETTDETKWSEAVLFGCENNNGYKCAALRIKYVEGDNAAYRFYDGIGNLFASSADYNCNIKDGYFEASGVCYVIKNNGEFEKSETEGKISSVIACSDNYAAVKSKAISGIYVCDRKSGKTIYSLFVDPESCDLSVYFTADEKLLVQEIVKEAVATSKYTFIDDGGEKFTVKTRLITLGEEIKEEKLRYPFVIQSFKNATNDSEFKKVYDCENVATVYPIEDYRIAREAHAKVVIDNDGKAKDRIDNVEEGFVSAKSIGNGRWLIKTKFGEVKVMTDDKEVLSVWSEEKLSSRFSEIGGMLYDVAEDAELNLKDNGYEFIRSYDFYAILEDSEGNGYYYDKKINKIENYAGVWGRGYYTENDGKRSYYSDKLLFSSYGEIGVFSITEKDAIIEYKTSIGESGFVFLENYYL